jgi:ribosomal protein S18 acetylase RimI-like enzyme
MDIVYFKRYRMEIKLAGRDLTPPPAPPRYTFLPWTASLLDAFSQAKHRSFRNEIDTDLFPCLADFEGCRRLMSDIARKPGFLPQATWLLAYTPVGSHRPEYCGTVQGVRDKYWHGSIQNLGVAPEHRNAGLGARLLVLALAGFHRSGIQRAYLEVTAKNHAAIRFYHRLGFVTVKTVYKTLETKCRSVGAK